jgi:hypothetical protein
VGLDGGWEVRSSGRTCIRSATETHPAGRFRNSR